MLPKVWFNLLLHTHTQFQKYINIEAGLLIIDLLGFLICYQFRVVIIIVSYILHIFRESVIYSKTENSIYILKIIDAKLNFGMPENLCRKQPFMSKYMSYWKKFGMVCP